MKEDFANPSQKRKPHPLRLRLQSNPRTHGGSHQIQFYPLSNKNRWALFLGINTTVSEDERLTAKFPIIGFEAQGRVSRISGGEPVGDGAGGVDDLNAITGVLIGLVGAQREGFGEMVKVRGGGRCHRRRAVAEVEGMVLMGRNVGHRWRCKKEVEQR